MKISKLVISNFMRFVNKTDTCWNWIGGRVRNEHGKFRHGPKIVYAHRFSWLAFKGPIPTGKKVLHTCDNMVCVNPDHLFIGTQADNMKDMANKGRSWSKTNKPNRKQVQEIRKLYTNGVSKNSLAKQFKCHRQTITTAVRGIAV